MGLLAIESAKPNAFWALHEAMALLGASLAGQVLARETSESYHAALRNLVVERLARAGTDRARVASEAVTIAAEVYQGTHVALWVQNSANGQLQGMYNLGAFEPAAEDAELPQQIVATLARQSDALGFRVLVSDNDPSNPIRPISTGEQWDGHERSRACMRLDVEGRVIGVLYLYLRPPRHFIATERRRLEDFGAAVALALDHSKPDHSRPAEAETEPDPAPEALNDYRLTGREMEVVYARALKDTFPKIADDFKIRPDQARRLGQNVLRKAVCVRSSTFTRNGYPNFGTQNSVTGRSESAAVDWKPALQGRCITQPKRRGDEGNPPQQPLGSRVAVHHPPNPRRRRVAVTPRRAMSAQVPRMKPSVGDSSANTLARSDRGEVARRRYRRGVHLDLVVVAVPAAHNSTC